MRRELYEETSLRALSERLVDVHDLHTVGPARDEQYEDYHGVHLLYAVSVDPEREPAVIEVDGTTDRVQWVEVETAPTIGQLLPAVEFVLERLPDYRQPMGGMRASST